MSASGGGGLAGRVAIVTGSTRGIGRAIAERFHAEGARVVVHGQSADHVSAVCARLPGAAAVAGDIAAPGTSAELATVALEQFGAVDILVNNAGMTIDGYLTRISDEEWHRVLDVNLSGPFYATRAVVPAMKAQGRGSIINVVSWSGARGNPGQASYSASKAGLHGLTLACAKELVGFGIRVNALSPNAATDMTAAVDAAVAARAVGRIPMQRVGSLDEVADAAVFLASDRATFITGEVLHVDGGLHLT